MSIYEQLGVPTIINAVGYATRVAGSCPHEVVIEAMALGKPVVCLDTGGPGMHINEECGIKILPSTPKQTEKDLAKALEQLYVDENLRKLLGEAAKQKIKGHYLWDRLGDRVAEIYQQAVSDRND